MPFRYDYTDGKHGLINVAPIDFLAAEFYTLETLSLLSAIKLDKFRHSHERFCKDLWDYKRFFEQRTARIIFDYIVCASAGEARHGYGNASRCLTSIPKGGNRGEVIPYITKYTPESIAIACNELFGIDTTWNDGYGGLKWAAISNSILLYKKIPTTAWIDHCVDLSHNSSTCFNKPDYRILTALNSYTHFLTKKTYATTIVKLFEVVFEYEMQVGLSFRLKNLLLRAEALTLIDSHTCERFFARGEYYHSGDISAVNPPAIDPYGNILRDQVGHVLDLYDPIQWGSETLPIDFSEGLHRESGSNCDDNDCSDCHDCDDTGCDDHPSNGNCDQHNCCLCSWDNCSEHPSNGPEMCYECESTECEYFKCDDDCYECSMTDCDKHPINNCNNDCCECELTDCTTHPVHGNYTKCIECDDEECEYVIKSKGDDMSVEDVA